MSENSDSNNNRYWEQYLVRYFVPTIIAGLCIGFLLLHDKLGFIGITNSEQTKSITQILNTFKDKVNIYLCIGFALVSFAYVYVVSGISMVIHVCLPAIFRHAFNKEMKFRATSVLKIVILLLINLYYIFYVFIVKFIILHFSIQSLNFSVGGLIDFMLSFIYIFVTLELFIELKQHRRVFSILFLISVFILCLIAVQHIVCLIVTGCHSLVEFSPKVYEYYRQKYKNRPVEFLIAAKHLKEHGASFQNSLLIIIFTILIYFDFEDLLISEISLAFPVGLLVLGTFYGTIMGAYIEARYLKENPFDSIIIKHRP